MTGLNLCPYTSPCTPDCPNRSVEPNCHSTCEKYLAFREQVDSTTGNKYAKSDLNTYTRNQIERQRRHAATHTWKRYRNRMN